MSLSLFNMIGDARQKNTFGLMDMFEGVKDTIFPILQNTPYGYAYEKSKKNKMNFFREVGEGTFHDLPQGVIDLGTDIINRGSNLVGVEGDLINRDSVQVVPQVFDAGEREQLGMKPYEEDSVGRILGQLLGGYAGIRGVLSKGLMNEAISVAGAGSTLDPTRPNLSNFMQDTRFNNALFEYMSAGVPEEAGAEERLLARVGNMTEELGLAFIPLGLIQGLRTMKNNPAIKDEILDTFHPDRISGLLTDKTGVTTDYRMLAAPEDRLRPLTPTVDEAGFYLKSEQQVMAMQQNQMQASHVEGFLKKRGVSTSEMEDIGLLDMLNGLPEGEMITKQGLLNFIDDNRITMDTQTLVPGGGDAAYTSLAAPDPNDYYLNERKWREGVYRETGSTEGLEGVEWETNKWYSGDGDNKWRIMENEHHDMRTNEFWDDITSELNNLKDEHGAFQFDKTGEMFESLKTFEQLSKLYPDKYPPTTVMRMDKLRDAIRSREQFIDRDAGQSNTGIQVARQEMAKARRELQELELNFKWGSEWDADILRGLQDGTLDNQILTDMEEAVELRVTNEYMNHPYFEVKVGDDNLGHYIFRGNDDFEWTIHDESGANIFADDSPSMRSSPTLAEAQVELRDYVEANREGYDYDIGEAKYTNTSWIQPNADMATYSEELVRLNDTPIHAKRMESGILPDAYEGGHYGDDYPNTFGHIRKTIRSGTVVHPDITVTNEIKGQFADVDYSKVGGTQYSSKELRKGKEDGLFDWDENVYMVEELQSDWMQEGREYGFGNAEQHRLLDLSETKVKELGEVKTNLDVYINHLQDYMTRGLTTDATGKRMHLYQVDRQMELNQLPEILGGQNEWVTGNHYQRQQKFLEMTPNNLLQKAFQLGDRQGHRMSHAPVKELGFDPDDYSRAIQASEVRSAKEWNDMWKIDPRNPEAENFKGFGLADLEELQKYISEEIDLENTWQNNQLHKPVPEFSPVSKQSRDIHLMVKHSINKALENGSTRVAFPNGDMILNVWNKHLTTVQHGKVRFEEMYQNLYDKEIPKFIKKYAKQHGGKVGRMYIPDFDREVFFLEITKEMKSNLRKEVKPPYQTMSEIEAKGIMTPQSLYAKFPLPIGAGLLGMQDEKNESGLLN